MAIIACPLNCAPEIRRWGINLSTRTAVSLMLNLFDEQTATELSIKSKIDLLILCVFPKLLFAAKTLAVKITRKILSFYNDVCWHIENVSAKQIRRQSWLGWCLRGDGRWCYTVMIMMIMMYSNLIAFKRSQLSPTYIKLKKGKVI